MMVEQRQSYALPYRYYNRIRNSGDAVNPFIIEAISGASPYFSSHDGQHVLAIGSILFMANRNSLIWGSGQLNPASYLPPLLANQIFALRGEKTLTFLREKGIDIGDVPLGDPGIFASELIPPKSSPTQHRIVVVPHHSSIGCDFYKNAAQRDDVYVANVMTDDLSLLEKIRDCDVVVSESLHGLIFGESFGKPCVWISNHIGDSYWNFKFQDWFSTTRMPNAEPFSLKESLDKLVEHAARAWSAIDLKRLKAAFPIQVKRQAIRLVPFRQCREHAPATLFIDQEELDLKTYSRGEESGLFRKINSAKARFFGGWAERIYLYVAFSSAVRVLSPDEVKQCCRILDEHLSPDALVLVAPTEKSLFPRLARDNLLDKEKLSGRLMDGKVAGVILRPDSEATERWSVLAL